MSGRLVSADPVITRDPRAVGHPVRRGYRGSLRATPRLLDKPLPASYIRSFERSSRALRRIGPLQLV
jgi:hypothetical protein